MSNNYYNYNQLSERNETSEIFDLSKEDLKNCFGSQISFDSSQSNNNNQNVYNPLNITSSSSQSSSQSTKNKIDKDELIKNICHGFIDMYFDQREELIEIQNEIKKTQNMILNRVNSGNNNHLNTNNNTNNINNINNDSNITFQKIIKNCFQYFNYKTNIECQNNQINKEINCLNNLNNTKPRSKSPNPSISNKLTIPETVQEVEEEYELSTNKKRKNSETKKKEKIYVNNVSNMNKINNINNTIDLTSDEIQSDFISGGKKVKVKLDNNLRAKLTKEMSSLDEEGNILEELSKNKKPSNIRHNSSKLSCSDENEVNKTIKMFSKIKLNKRNYNTIIKSYEREGKINEGSIEERGRFTKRMKKCENYNENKMFKNRDIDENKINSK